MVLYPFCSCLWLQGVETNFVDSRHLHKDFADWRTVLQELGGVLMRVGVKVWIHVSRQDISPNPIVNLNLILPPPHLGGNGNVNALSRRQQSLACWLGQINCNQLRFPLTDVEHGRVTNIAQCGFVILAYGVVCMYI